MQPLFLEGMPAVTSAFKVETKLSPSVICVHSHCPAPRPDSESGSHLVLLDRKQSYSPEPYFLLPWGSVGSGVLSPQSSPLALSPLFSGNLLMLFLFYSLNDPHWAIWFLDQLSGLLGRERRGDLSRNFASPTPSGRQPGRLGCLSVSQLPSPGKPAC